MFHRASIQILVLSACATLAVGPERASLLNQWPWVPALTLASCAPAQAPANDRQAIWRGAWVATAGPTGSFRGRWSGQLLPNTVNAAQGSWTLLNDSNQSLLEGTWSAQKTLRTWRGSWTARLATGQSFRGTWMSDMTDVDGKSFEDMLKATIEKQVSGSWRSGRMQGNWWLQGSR
jgi:hypothetical protein